MRFWLTLLHFGAKMPKIVTFSLKMPYFSTKTIDSKKKLSYTNRTVRPNKATPMPFSRELYVAGLVVHFVHPHFVTTHGANYDRCQFWTIPIIVSTSLVRILATFAYHSQHKTGKTFVPVLCATHFQKAGIDFGNHHHQRTDSVRCGCQKSFVLCSSSRWQRYRTSFA